MKITLCLDQSTSDIGWALINENEILDYGVKHLDKKRATPERMYDAIEWLNSLPFSFDEIVFENVQLQAGNAQTFQILSQLQGFIMLWAMKTKRPYTIYASTSWKSTCGVKGRKRVEQKANAHLFAEREYGISPLLSQDAVDAICIAHHHLEQLKKT